VAVSTISPAQVAHLGEVWFVGFDFKAWVPSTVTPTSNTITATDKAGVDKTGTVISGEIVSGTKSVALFSNFLTAEIYTVIVETVMSNGEKHRDSISITTDTL